MRSSYNGDVLNQCDNLSMEDKREFVYEISKCSHDAPEMLESWSRQELLQILCAEVGKEKRYTTLPKMKIITLLIRIFSKKARKITDGPALESMPSLPNSQTASKRQRKSENLSRLGSDLESRPLPPNNQTTSKRKRKSDNHTLLGSVLDSKPSPPNSQTTCKRPRKNENPLRIPVEIIHHPIHCPNMACRATLCEEGSFCKLCSCYICYSYDHDKDPSLWLFCSQEPPYPGDSCGMSCHLECALRHIQPVAENEHHAKLDVSFLCASCGKMNDLLRCLRNQLSISKDTRNVEVLCYRLSVSQKLLRGTKKYQKIHDLVAEGVRKLEAEVGPSSVNKREGIVSGLSSGLEVQNLCACALKLLDSIFSCGALLPVSDSKVQDSNLTSPNNLIRFEYVSPTSTTVVLGYEEETSIAAEWYSLWHRRADVDDYPAEPTCILFTPRLRFTFFDLTPASDYILKVVSFCNLKEETWEVRFMTSCDGNVKSSWGVVERGPSTSTNSNSLSNPCSDGDESNNLDSCKDKNIASQIIPNSSKLVNKGTSASQNRSTATSPEETPGNSVSAVTTDECIMEEVRSMPNFPGVNSHSINCTNVAQNEYVRESGTCTGSNTTPAVVEIVPFEYGYDDTRPSSPCELVMVGRNEFSGNTEEDYMHCVKVIRSLECKRYIEKNFREKFLSWYSLRATKEEQMSVKEVVDTLKDEPMSLSGKLIGTFSERIFSKRRTPAASSKDWPEFGTAALFSQSYQLISGSEV